MARTDSVKSVKFEKRRSLLYTLGPGLIAGASDDDPSGIATYGQAGAQFGYSLGWTLLFSYPLMCAIQEICARIGRVTGSGLAANFRRHYSRTALYVIVALLLVANTINLAADLGAMAAAVRLLIGGPQLAYVIFFGLATVILQIFFHYQQYAAVLKWLTLSLFCYVGTAFVTHIPWDAVMAGLLLPRVSPSAEYLTVVVAILGTTISPYLFFWQASLEVEEQRADPEARPLKRSPMRKASHELHRIRTDTYIGMALSNLVALFIVITTAATLHAHHVTDIGTSAQAAEALRPIAGPLAFAVFSAGIVGTGLLAVPVLAGSAAYAVGEALAWRVGLAQRPSQARRFYGAIAAVTLLGIVLTLAPLDPVKALFWSAVINGVIAVPIMVMVMLLAARPRAMGKLVLSPGLALLGWLSTAIMGVSAGGMIATWLM